MISGLGVATTGARRRRGGRRRQRIGGDRVGVATAGPRRGSVTPSAVRSAGTIRVRIRSGVGHRSGMVAAVLPRRRRPLVLVPSARTCGHACRSSPACVVGSPSRRWLLGGLLALAPDPPPPSTPAPARCRRTVPSTSRSPAASVPRSPPEPRRRRLGQHPPPLTLIGLSAWPRPWSCPGSTSRLDRRDARPDAATVRRRARSPRSPRLAASARRSARRRRLRRHARRGLARSRRGADRAARPPRAATAGPGRAHAPGRVVGRDPDRPDRRADVAARVRVGGIDLPRRPRPAVGDLPARRRPGPDRDHVPWPATRRSRAPAEILAARRRRTCLGRPAVAVRRAQGAVGRVPRPPGRRSRRPRAAAVEAADRRTVDRELPPHDLGPLPRPRSSSTCGRDRRVASARRSRRCWRATRPATVVAFGDDSQRRRTGSRSSGRRGRPALSTAWRRR